MKSNNSKLKISLGKISNDYNRIKTAFPKFGVFYTIKANDHPVILDILGKQVDGFEITSESEVDAINRIGFDLSKVICMNTIKPPSFIRKMKEADIRIMAVDSIPEIEKILGIYPEAKMVLRIKSEVAESLYLLDNKGKFGVDVEGAKEIIDYCANKKIDLYGITCHVGSQSISAKGWLDIIDKAKFLFDYALMNHMSLGYLSLGGGLPVKYLEEVISFEKLGQEITNHITKIFGKNIPELSIEPGRAVVARSGTIEANVIGKALRKGQKWIYLDVGVFNGLMEAVGGFQFAMTTTRDQNQKFETIVAGPTCDGFDVINYNQMLPDLEIGDVVEIKSVGAYSNVYASNFNGYACPEIIFVD